MVGQKKKLLQTGIKPTFICTMKEYEPILFQYVTPVIGGLAILANMSEIISIMYHRHNNGGYALVYIFSLSMSDLLMGIMMVILKSMHPFMKTTLKGNTGAKEAYDLIRFGCIRFALLMSIFNLIALSIDRVRAVKNPIKYRLRDGKHTIWIPVGLWCMAFLCISLYYWISRELFQNTKRYINLIFPVAIFSAFIIFIGCYGIILHALVKHRRTFDIKIQKLPDDRRLHPRPNIEYKVVKVAIINVMVFLTCWVPFATVSLIRGLETLCVSRALFSTCFTLASCSTVINPCMYWIRTKKTFGRACIKPIPDILVIRHSTSS
ncbi:adenosine receptor A2b-like [Hydractinia symbiolongicarpus]|uniref:adenosine receptor A2b-like n=1 Tax=Hydractinia symbiolongicarpus TaxID=13093 RepID=UPI00254EE38C|nr:adenosine receptor A2b-like [Hydractinia symbiolongicarpus]